MAKTQPVIKWSGSKRHQAEEIIKFFPDEIDCYYEPFCGGCSVARALMESRKKVNTYFLSDFNSHLINALNAIKDDYRKVSAYYSMMWNALKKIEDMTSKQEFYLKLREKFNDGHDPLDFIVLNRLCYNGLIRYNSKGEFNTSYHMNRDGIKPDAYEKILEEWHELFTENDVQFACIDYREIDFGNGFVYMDPPYANTHGMYDNGFSQEEFFKFLERLPIPYAFSYDGKSGGNDMTENVPKQLYHSHYYIKSGNSSFKRLKNNNNNVVYESLYLKL